MLAIKFHDNKTKVDINNLGYILVGTVAAETAG